MNEVGQIEPTEEFLRRMQVARGWHARCTECGIDRTRGRIFIWARKLTLLNRYERKRPKVLARHRLVGSLPNVSQSCSACDRRFVQRNLGRRGARIGPESSNR